MSSKIVQHANQTPQNIQGNRICQTKKKNQYEKDQREYEDSYEEKRKLLPKQIETHRITILTKLQTKKKTEYRINVFSEK